MPIRYVFKITILFSLIISFYSTNLSGESFLTENNLMIRTIPDIIKSTSSGSNLYFFQIETISEIISKAAKNKEVLLFLEKQQHFNPFITNKIKFDEISTDSERWEYFNKQIDFLNNAGYDGQKTLLNKYREAIWQDKAWKEVIGGPTETIRLIALININYRHAESTFDEIKSNPDLTKETATRLLYLIYYQE